MAFIRALSGSSGGGGGTNFCYLDNSMTGMPANFSTTYSNLPCTDITTGAAFTPTNVVVVMSHASVANAPIVFEYWNGTKYSSIRTWRGAMQSGNDLTVDGTTIKVKTLDANYGKNGGWYLMAWAE